ncbi:MAG TPA: RHS repeat-associated core domain-containing protein, partial [Candidatus Babeliaceae bacterium]|nr:RHS repeat-associated core domain-containing protein [Candidatus Babeliaceae bacterium]
HYDQLNRIKKLRQHSSITSWSAGNINNKYSENFDYDGNGNILNLLRLGDTSINQDSLTYKYNRDANGNLTDNKLNYLHGNGNATNFGPPQSINNYQYDAIGELTSDAQSHLGHIAWTVYGKIDTIKRSSDTTIIYGYNTAQQRISKSLTTTSGNLTTYYTRDGQGNIISIYDNKSGNSNWREQHLYGSNRLGMWKPDVNLATDSAHIKWGTKGLKEYDLTNQLGNVNTTISDKRITDAVHGDYKADVKTAQDFFAFGAIMLGRSYNSDSTRFGFNGKENDNEVMGTGNWQDYGMRMYNPRVGRFPNVDPLTNSYPWYSPYQFAGNKPIKFFDRDGAEEDDDFDPEPPKNPEQVKREEAENEARRNLRTEEEPEWLKEERASENKKKEDEEKELNKVNQARVQGERLLRPNGAAARLKNYFDQLPENAENAFPNITKDFKDQLEQFNLNRENGQALESQLTNALTKAFPNGGVARQVTLQISGVVNGQSVSVRIRVDNLTSSNGAIDLYEAKYSIEQINEGNFQRAFTPNQRQAFNIFTNGSNVTIFVKGANGFNAGLSNGSEIDINNAKFNIMTNNIENSQLQHARTIPLGPNK